MDARLQLRVQRYGWDLAAPEYESLWQRQLADNHAALLEAAALRPGERVLDVACGPGTIAFAAAARVGSRGSVLGIDLSGRMIELARHRARHPAAANVAFERMDGQRIEPAGRRFDVAVCSLGLMYMPEPERCIDAMARVLEPGGRLVATVWGCPSRCGWSSLFPIVDDEVASDVCPLFFRLGGGDALAAALAAARLRDVAVRRVATTFRYLDGREACDAAFEAGPMALAWSRFDGAVRARVRARYLAGLEAFRAGAGYEVPSEFVIGTAVRA